MRCYCYCYCYSVYCILNSSPNTLFVRNECHDHFMFEMLGAFARKTLSTVGMRPLALQLNRSFLVPLHGQLSSNGLFGRHMSSTRDNTLYVPFLTDAERERASIFFWVTRNTNLKGVNVTKKVPILSGGFNR